jgi:hypothetical protein
LGELVEFEFGGWVEFELGGKNLVIWVVGEFGG